MSQRLLIGIEATRHCNLRCRHCLRADTGQPGEISLALVDRVLGEAKVFGRPHVALTGGEPTLHSRFFDLLGIIRRHQLTCNLVTNGQSFPGLVSDLTRFCPELRSLSFSLDGASDKTHDLLRGAGTFKRVLLAIGVARYRGFHVSVQLAVNRANREELPALPRLCRELGVNRLYVCHTQPTAGLYRAGLQLSPEEWREVEAEVSALATKRRGLRPELSIGGFDPGNVAPCMALQHRSLNIDWAGRLTVCCQLSGVGSDESDVVADLRKVSLLEAHRVLFDRLRELHAQRLELFGSGRLAPGDSFQCWPCYKHFAKLDWMRRFPTDTWVREESSLLAPQPIGGRVTPRARRLLKRADRP